MSSSFWRERCEFEFFEKRKKYKNTSVAWVYNDNSSIVSIVNDYTRDWIHWLVFLQMLYVHFEERDVSSNSSKNEKNISSVAWVYNDNSSIVSVVKMTTLETEYIYTCWERQIHFWRDFQKVWEFFEKRKNWKRTGSCRREHLSLQKKLKSSF